MVKFESYERRIKQIEEVLKKYEQYEVFEKTVKLDYLPN